MTAVQVHGARQVVALDATGLARRRSQICTRVCSRPGIAAGVGVVLMVMVTKMPGARLPLMRAIGSHRCPAELQGQHDEHEYDQELFHFLTM